MQKKKIKRSRALLITGICLFIGFYPFFIFLSVLVDDLDKPIIQNLISLFFIVCEPMSAIFFTFSLAASRIEKGKVRTANFFRALTKAQLVLIASAALMLVGGVWGVLTDSETAALLVEFASLGMLAACVIAVYSTLKKNRRWWKKPARQSAPQEKKPRACAKCAKLLPDNGAVAHMGTACYCDACYQKLLADYRRYKEMKHGGVQPAIRPAPPKPLQVKCVVCEKQMPNDGNVPHMGNRYYCADCYGKLRKKYLAKKAQGAKQDLVLVLNALLEQRIKIWEAEEKKRQEEERLYKANCAICGVERPWSTFRLVDDLYYCEACFSKKFADEEADDPGLFDDVPAENPQRQSAEAIGRFDRDAFMRNNKSVVAQRLPQNIEEPDTQKRLLDNLEQTIPDVHAAFAAAAPQGKRGAADGIAGVSGIASRVNGMLGAAQMDKVAPAWQNIPNERLIDAYILLDYYAFILGPEASVNICTARACVGAELQSRL